jgi:hypothetical protein
MKIRLVGAELFHTDRRTETDVTKLIVAFRNFANASKTAFDGACTERMTVGEQKDRLSILRDSLSYVVGAAFRQPYRTGWSSLPQSAGMPVDMSSACFHRLLTRSTVHF